MLVYLAIGVSGVALLALGVGAAVKWRELSGKPKTAASDVGAQQVGVQQVGAQQPVTAGAAAAQGAQAQPELQGYPRPAAAAAAGPAGRGRPAEAAVGQVPYRSSTASAVWESAVPPTGTFPAIRPDMEPPGTRPWRDDAVSPQPEQTSRPEPEQTSRPTAAAPSAAAASAPGPPPPPAAGPPTS